MHHGLSTHDYSSGYFKILSFHFIGSFKASYLSSNHMCVNHLWISQRSHFIAQLFSNLHFSNISNAYFSTKQQRDTRYVIPATIIPLAHISINECNPVSDIRTNTNTIQTRFDVAHIYEDNGRHLIIAHFAADTIIYEEPTIPPELNIIRKEVSTLRILCIHHQNNHIGNYEQMNQLTDIASILQILQIHTQTASPTPLNTTVNPSKKWAKSTYPNPPTNNNTPIPQLPNYHTNFPPKFHLQFSYYTNGSFMGPKEINPGVWRRERVGYGIYSPKGLNISKRLHGHQNILRAEMVAIHKTLEIINTLYPNEPAYIFTDNLNVLYVLNTQIKHPTLHNSHPD